MGLSCVTQTRTILKHIYIVSERNFGVQYSFVANDNRLRVPSKLKAESSRLEEKTHDSATLSFQP